LINYFLEKKYKNKIKKPVYIKLFSPPDFWSNIGSISSFVALVLTIALMYNTFSDLKVENKQFNFIITSLVW